jgi:chromosome segregation ATPase
LAWLPTYLITMGFLPYFIGAIAAVSITCAARAWWKLLVVRDDLDRAKRLLTDRGAEIDAQTERERRLRTDIQELRVDLQELNRSLRKRDIRLGQLVAAAKRGNAKIGELRKCITKKDALYKSLQGGKGKGLERISSLISDYLTLQYELSATALETKAHPARKEAQRIRDLRDETRAVIERSKRLEYENEMLRLGMPMKEGEGQSVALQEVRRRSIERDAAYQRAMATARRWEASAKEADVRLRTLSSALGEMRKRNQELRASITAKDAAALDEMRRENQELRASITAKDAAMITRERELCECIEGKDALYGAIRGRKGQRCGANRFSHG